MHFLPTFLSVGELNELLTCRDFYRIQSAPHPNAWISIYFAMYIAPGDDYANTTDVGGFRVVELVEFLITIGMLSKHKFIKRMSMM